MQLFLSVVTLAVSASAFAPATDNAASTVSLSATRRDSFAAFTAAVVAAPSIASAVAGDSPKFSVFGIIGDGKSMSEGAAYGSDQATRVYSPYSVYDARSDKSVFKETDPGIPLRKKAIIAESRVRLTKIEPYIAKKQWFNVRDELTRYMYSLRDSMVYFTTDAKTKAAAKKFFVSLEKLDISAKQRKGDVAEKARQECIVNLDAFIALI
mmetsp:Transcript_42813/g.84123  ORF Transcript_42813/g.84123 Transcript_42813/m.84123 type:complete len:210 (+) Transcript_42813:83-712(+)